MTKKLTGLLLLLFGTTMAFGQQFSNLDQEIPFDSRIRTGVLPNGITYYVMNNPHPAGKASYYIYQNVGAVLENDDQDGLAHFLEHMAFNGTSTYPGNSMLDMLERYGVKFGKDVNAYTALNETVYNISRVPSENEKLIDSCLYILRDWCNELTLETKEIDAERGVITEEWRSRYNAGYRLGEKINPTLYNGTIYGVRNVIGNMDVVKNFDPETLRQFYHDWYRTDLQAVAIVGDIDAEKVEKRVIELFSAIPAVKNAKPRNSIEIPDSIDDQYALATDTELKYGTITLSIRHKDETTNTYGSLRKMYVKNMFNGLMKKRLGELVADGDAPFLGGSIYYKSLVKGYNSLDIVAKAREDAMLPAFRSVYAELERVLQYGFTEGELDRMKKNMLAAAEKQFRNSGHMPSENYCKSLKTAFLEGYSVSDPQFKYDFVKEVIPSITLEDITAFAQENVVEMNRVFTVTGPVIEDFTYPELNELQAAIQEVELLDLEPYQDSVPEDMKLLSYEPKGGKILEEKRLDDFKAVEWKLSNGTRVVYRYSNFQRSNISLKAVSYGGSSLYPVEDLPSYNSAGKMIGGFGIGSFDAVSYGKIMTGSSAKSSFYMGKTSETVTASAEPKDLETMMKLVYMRFEEPRFDEDKFDNLLARSIVSMESNPETAESVMRDTVDAILRGNDPRHVRSDINFLRSVDFDRMVEIYKERFDDASDFTFFIVGNVKEKRIRTLVEKYIGALNGKGSKEAYITYEDHFPEGENHHKITVAMEHPKATYMMKMKDNFRYNRKRLIEHSIMGYILNLRFTENIREKEGGTYGVRVNASASRVPREELSLDISFSCDPERVDHLKDLVYKELEIIQSEVRENDLEKVLQNLKKTTANRMHSNKFWMDALERYYENGEDMTQTAYLEEILDKVTTKDIQRSARRFLKNADLLDIIFVPEEAAQKTALKTVNQSF
ncbi:M16 family metallopeptidase [Robertkochia solimangrovi]|uniref:M16 family metallopeptidase n=1 Tax=Robertkochia solimangrovi TaxID=2213046 RepID=UPI00117C61DA|nr:M16 family metallopeptidase [Robertkochia solimangrovi]TRZ45077.1 insulinase family protein [Robertkochia solimangrovi]